jgi:uncharacterized protein (TIGR00270 family)
MDCEMCGKTAVAKAAVEGALLYVCASCAKHGSNARAIPQAPPKQKKSLQAESRPPREELIEQVRPDVAKLLRQAREKLKLDPEQYAAKLQIRLSTYHHYESGAAVPDIPTARKLEHALGVPLVVHVRVSSGPVKHEESRGLQLGDFLKRR